MTQTPIYDQVCEDLKVFPRAIPRRTHTQFMRERQQERWLKETLRNVYHPAGLLG